MERNEKKLSIGDLVRVNVDAVKKSGNLDAGSQLQDFIDHGDHSQIFKIQGYYPCFLDGPYLLDGALENSGLAAEELILVEPEDQPKGEIRVSGLGGSSQLRALSSLNIEQLYELFDSITGLIRKHWKNATDEFKKESEGGHNEIKNARENICPICGEEIEYEGDQEIVDDGTLVSFHCPKCGCAGKAGYDLVFDNFYRVQDENGDPVNCKPARKRSEAPRLSVVVEDGYASLAFHTIPGLTVDVIDLDAGNAVTSESKTQNSTLVKNLEDQAKAGHLFRVRL